MNDAISCPAKRMMCLCASFDDLNLIEKIVVDCIFPREFPKIIQFSNNFWVCIYRFGLKIVAQNVDSSSNIKHLQLHQQRISIVQKQLHQAHRIAIIIPPQRQDRGRVKRQIHRATPHQIRSRRTLKWHQRMHCREAMEMEMEVVVVTITTTTIVTIIIHRITRMHRMPWIVISVL